MSTRSLQAAPPASPARLIGSALEGLERVVIGKPQQLRLALSCLLAKGHLLIEDMPGVGKTTLAHALAHVLGLSYQRVQFTSDLLPADIIGVSVYERDTGNFKFHRGPIFSQLVLADEINRATPKAQSALLEAMEERQVTAEGQCLALPAPFFVVATRNPSHQVGTFPLPESQLDRFLMQISLGYPSPEDERELLVSGDRRKLLEDTEPALSTEALVQLQNAAEQVSVAPALLDYVQALLAHTRDSGHYTNGLSPRGGMALIKAAQAWALMRGHRGVHPEDVQAVLPGVVTHRLDPARGTELNPDDVASDLVDAVPIP